MLALRSTQQNMPTGLLQCPLGPNKCACSVREKCRKIMHSIVVAAFLPACLGYGGTVGSQGLVLHTQTQILLKVWSKAVGC